jgi:hypothetical protein
MTMTMRSTTHGGQGGIVRDHRHGTATVAAGYGWWPYYSGSSIVVPIPVCYSDPNDPELCPDERVIVGHPNGVPYGSWGTAMRVPHTIAEVGVDFRHFSDPIAGQMVSSASGQHTVVGTGARDDHAAAAVFRVGFGGTHLYGAFEAEIGALTTTPPVIGSSIDSTLPPAEAMMFGYAGVFGVAERIGRARVGVEGVAGGRTVSYSFGANGTEFGATATVPVVEARVRGELWLNPWFAAGATFGASVIERNDWVGAFYLAMHTRAFGGQY